MKEKKGNYTDKKTMAYRMIEDIISSGECNLYYIELQVARKFGFGKKMIHDHLDLLVKNNIITIVGDSIALIPKEVKNE